MEAKLPKFLAYFLSVYRGCNPNYRLTVLAKVALHCQEVFIEVKLSEISAKKTQKWPAALMTFKRVIFVP